MNIYYFGCIGQSGHFLWQDEHNKVYYSQHRSLGINERLIFALDGAFTPPTQKQQVWLCSIVPPWTIVSWWDCSVDKRPNSVSAIIGKHFCNEPNKLLEEARKLFPVVFSRQPELSEWTEP